MHVFKTYVQCLMPCPQETLNVSQSLWWWLFQIWVRSSMMTLPAHVPVEAEFSSIQPPSISPCGPHKTNIWLLLSIAINVAMTQPKISSLWIPHKYHSDIQLADGTQKKTLAGGMNVAPFCCLWFGRRAALFLHISVFLSDLLTIYLSKTY